MRYRPLALAGLFVASALVIPATQSAAESETTTANPPRPPVATAIPMAQPRPVPPMKALPRTATVKDYQKAVASVA